MGHTKEYWNLLAYSDKAGSLVKNFYKEPEWILSMLEDELIEHLNIYSVTVLGLGYRETDYPYFKEINRIIPHAKWILYYYSDDDCYRAHEYIRKLNICDENVQYLSLKTNSPFLKYAKYCVYGDN